MARQSAAIEAMLRDPEATGVIVVAAPEQMAVTEALELRRALHTRLGIQIEAVVVNRTVSSPFKPGETRKLAALDIEDPAVSSALWLHERARSHRAHLARLRGNLRGIPCIALPFVFAGLGDLEPLGRLAERLDRSLP
jgi:anion-transporting  ArsA/GET3 family ATPase